MLTLPVEDAGSFLCRTCGEDFHWRDPVEIVYLFTLWEGLSYTQAQALEREMREKGLLDVPDTVSSMVRQILRRGLQALPARRYSSVAQMRDAFQELLAVVQRCYRILSSPLLRRAFPQWIG